VPLKSPAQTALDMCVSGGRCDEMIIDPKHMISGISHLVHFCIPWMCSPEAPLHIPCSSCWCCLPCSQGNSSVNMLTQWSLNNDHVLYYDGVLPDMNSKSEENEYLWQRKYCFVLILWWSDVFSKQN
jgi:hypothetical protein